MKGVEEARSLCMRAGDELNRYIEAYGSSQRAAGEHW
jgi:hypothetical protein